MRLDKYLSKVGYTRSEAIKLIAKKKVFVGDVLITKKDFNIDENKDVAIVDGQKVFYKQNYYYMLNKPAGVVTANFDKNEKTISDDIIVARVHYFMDLGLSQKDAINVVMDEFKINKNYIKKLVF